MSLAPAVISEDVPKVCTVRDVCRHLQMSRATFYRLLELGAIPVIELDRIGRVRRFQGASVAAMQRGAWAKPAPRRVASRRTS